MCSGVLGRNLPSYDDVPQGSGDRQMVMLHHAPGCAHPPARRGRPMTGETNPGAPATEAVRPGGLDLGATSTPLLVAMMADDMADVQVALRGASAAIVRAIDRIEERMRAGGGSSTWGRAPPDALRSWTRPSAFPP